MISIHKLPAMSPLMSTIPSAKDNSVPRAQAATWQRILRQNSLARHWARDWLALALTQVHHGSRLSDSCEGGEALSSVHPPTPATGKLIHNLLCDGRVKND